MSFAPAFLRLSSSPVSFSCRPLRASRPAAAALLLALCSLPVCLLPAQAQDAGTRDTTFLPVASDLTAFTIGIQEGVFNTQRIIEAGDNRLLQRSLTDGTNDSSFTQVPTFGGGNRTVYTLAFETTFPGTDVGTLNSRIYIGGLFGPSSSATTGQILDDELNITRLNTDGTIDTTFNAGGRGANDYVTAILPFPASMGSGVLVGGVFERFNGEDHPHLVKLDNNGSVDTAYNPDLQAGDTVFALAHQIDASTGLPNGQVLVAGSFNRINQSEPAKLARLNADGTLDTSFNPEFTTRVLALAVQPDGKIIVGGSFDTANGQSVNNLLRLNQDGTTDSTFAASVTGNIQPVNTPQTAVYTLRIVPDGTGRIVVGGNFLKVNETTRNYLARLNADGSLDAGFDPGKTYSTSVQFANIQNDNKIVTAATRINRPSDDAPYPNVILRLYGGAVPTPQVSILPVFRRARSGVNRRGDGVQDGRFEIARSLPLGAALSVTFGIYGTARPNIGGNKPKDYTLFFYDDSRTPPVVTARVPLLPANGAVGNVANATVTIPAYSDHLLVEVVPKKFNRSAIRRRATFILQGGSSAYRVGSPDRTRIKVLPSVILSQP